MNFSLCRPVKILLLGAGGTGGYVAPHLYRLMHTLNRPVRINIVDGDLVEAKNLVRQNFCAADLGENKAKVLATRYSEAFGMETLYHPAFLEKDEDLYRMVQPGDIWLDGKRVPELSILIGCVDNNKSRQMCHRVFERSSHLVYIDSGNDEFSGQVVCGIRCNRRTIYKPVCKLYPDMLEETDNFPSELSCAEAAVSAPQSIGSREKNIRKQIRAGDCSTRENTDLYEEPISPDGGFSGCAQTRHHLPAVPQTCERGQNSRL